MKFLKFVKMLEEGHSNSDIILESRLDFLKKQNDGKISTQHDRYAKHTNSSDIIDHFAKHADPTKNKQHTQWILHQYKAGKIRQEDAPRIHDVLSEFEKHKNKLPEKDINKYKSLSDVEDAVHPHKDTAATKAEQTAEDVSKGRTLIHDTPHFKVYRLEKTPEGKRASQHIYGGGSKLGGTHTDWCTAARSKYCEFEDYSKKGHLYTIHTKDKKGKESVYQYHPASEQLMDAKDHDVSMRQFVTKHPELRKVHELSGTHEELPAIALTPKQKREIQGRFKTGEGVTGHDIRAASVHENETGEEILKPAHIKKLVEKGDPKIHRALIEHGYKYHLTPHDISAIARNPSSHEAHARLMSHGGSRLSHDDVRSILHNRGSTEAHIEAVRSHAKWGMHLEPEDVDHLIRHSPETHQEFIRHHIEGKVEHLKPEHIHIMMNNPHLDKFWKYQLERHQDQ